MAADHLLADDRGRRGRRRGLLAGAKHGGGRDEGEDSDFHVCVWVLTSFRFPSTRLLAAGFFEINDNFCFCKHPNAISAKTRKRGVKDEKLEVVRMSGGPAQTSTQPKNPLAPSP